MTDLIQQFSLAMQARGIVPPRLLQSDGELHRCDAEGRNGENDAAYVLHLDGVPIGGFENWRDGKGWEQWRVNSDHPLTASQRQFIEVAQQKREAEATKRHKEAQEQAARLWDGATECTAHAYLTRKGVPAYGLKENQGALLVPIRDLSGNLQSLQFIAVDGAKRFLTGGQVRGGFHLIGEVYGDIACVAEGYATAATIHKATGYPVAVAFNCGNLVPVTRTMREVFPNAKIILCADDDYQTDGNPGRTKANEAALIVGGAVAVPDFGANRPDGATDFNDLQQHLSECAVKRCVDHASNNASPVQSAPYAGGIFQVSERGVYYLKRGKDGDDMPPLWLSSRIDVVAMTRNNKSQDWGRLLEWQDADGDFHQWAIPSELLQSDGPEARKELARLGLQISPSKAARELLVAYLQVWPVERRACCVDKLGWNARAYVTPLKVLGADNEQVVFQNAAAQDPAFATSGTSDDWRASVAQSADGNSRLVFALSVAFTGPLMELAGEDSGGFHLRGASSSGKSTALALAASVWGSPQSYPRLWRATANGLEGLAAIHNDGLLILDELSQIDPKEAGEAAYLLANGQGKARASRSGAARAAAQWRLVFLSAGEETLSGLMAKAGKRANAGQEIRLADIEADAGAGMGAFENLHDHETPAGFALALKEAALRCHGAVGLEFLRKVVADRSTLPDLLQDAVQQFVSENVPLDAAGQVLRVARRFGLAAAAGELATHYELTGWSEGEADKAAKVCFTAWLEGFGGSGNREQRAILDHVKAFIGAHGASRFEPIAPMVEQRVANRVGFYRTNHETQIKEYLVLAASFEAEICAGFGKKVVVDALLKVGWLIPGSDGRPTQKPRIAALGSSVRCYVLSARLFEGE